MGLGRIRPGPKVFIHDRLQRACHQTECGPSGRRRGHAVPGGGAGAVPSLSLVSDGAPGSLIGWERCLFCSPRHLPLVSSARTRVRGLRRESGPTDTTRTSVSSYSSTPRPFTACRPSHASTRPPAIVGAARKNEGGDQVRSEHDVLQRAGGEGAQSLVGISQE